MSTTELALIKKDVVDVVAERVRKFQESKEIHLPANYSVENAMKSAWLILQATVDKDRRPALQACTRDSIANALLDMAVQGLNPAKKQIYFIVYGNQLVCQRSYHGTMAVARMVAPVKDINPQVVYGGDEFEYAIERGKKRITKHVQRIENVRPDNIVAAYCTIEFEDGRELTEIMTWDQIKAAWSKSKMNPEANGSTHKTFPEEMAKKTIINRTCKPVINTSSDNHLFLKHFNHADEELVEQELEEEIATSANGEIIDTEPTLVRVEDGPAETESAATRPAGSSTAAAAQADATAKSAPVQQTFAQAAGPAY